MMKATLLMQPRHNIHGMMTDTTNAPTSSYLNRETMDELRYTKSLPVEHAPAHGAAVVRMFSPVGVAVTTYVRFGVMLSKAVILSNAYVSALP